MEQQNVNKNPFAFEINNSKQKLQKFFNKVKYFERNYPEHNFRKSSFRGTFEENQRLPDDDFLKHSRNNRFRGNVIDKKKQNVFENGMNTLKKRKRRKKKKQKDICHGSFQDGQDNSFETSTIHSQKYRSPKKKQSNECPKNSHNNSFSAESTIIPTTYFGNDSVRISNCCANDKASSNLNNENCKKRRRKKQRDKECNTVDECTHSNETNRAENDKQVVLNGCESSVKKKHDTDLFYFDICGNKADKYVPVSVSKDVEDRLNILKKNFNQVNNDYKRKNFSNTVDTNTVQAIEYRKKSITNESYISQILDTNNTLKKQNSSVESINISGNDGYLSSSSNSTLYKKIKQSRGRINKEKISNSKKFEYDTTCGFTHNKPTLEQVTSKQKDENKNVKEYSYFNFASNKIKNVAEHIYDKNDIPLEIDLESVHTKQIETVNGTEGNEEENIYCKKIKKRKRRHENYVNGKESDCDISTKHSIQKNNMKDRNDFLGSEEMSKSVENMQRIFKVPNQVKKKNRNKTSDTVNISESECEIIDTSSSKKKKKHKTKTKESDIQKCCFQDNNNVEDLLDNLTNINQDNTSESDGITAKSFNTKKKKSKPLQTESNISKKSVTCEKDIDDIHYKKCSDLGNTITPEKNQCLGNSFKAYKNHKLNRDSVENEGNSLTIIEPKIYKISQVEEAEINKGNKKIKDNDFHIVTNISESECEIVNTLNLKKKKKHKIINIQLGSNNTPKKNLKQNTNKCINLDNHLQEVLGKIKDTSNETNIDDCKFVKNKNKKHKPSRTENGPLKDIEDMEFTEKRLLNDVFDGLKNYELVCKDPVENGGGRIQNENYKVSQSTETKAREINKEIKARRIDTLTNGCDMDSVNSSSKKKRKLVTSTESNAYDAPKKKHKTKKVKNDNNSNIKNISDTSHIALRSDSDEVTLFDKVRKMKKKKLKTLQTVDIVLDHSECQITSRSELDEITLTDELPKKKFKAMQTVDSVLNHPEDQITSRSESDEITLIDELPKIKKKLKTLYTEDNVLEHRAGQMTSRGESHEITLIDELPKMKKKKLKTLQTEDNVLGHLEGQITSRSKADEITLIDKLPKIKNKKFKTLPTEDSVLDHSEGQKTLRSEPDEITLIDELPKIKKKKLKTMQTVDSVLDHSEDQITSRSESDEITLIDELPKMKNKKLKTLHTEDNVLEYHAGQMTSRNDSDEITFIDELPMLKKKKLKTLHTEDSVFDHSEGQITLITLIDGLPKMKKKKIKTLCTEDIVLDHPEGQLTSRNESDEITLTDELPKVKKKKVKTLQSEDSILDHLKEQEISLMEKVNNPRDCVELNVAKSLKKKYIVDDVLEQNGSILLENSSLTNDQNSDSSEIIIPEWKSVRHKEHFTQADEKDTKNSISIDDTLLLSENYDKCYIDKLNPKTETRFDNVENKGIYFFFQFFEYV